MIEDGICVLLAPTTVGFFKKFHWFSEVFGVLLGFEVSSRDCFLSGRRLLLKNGCHKLNAG
jgi:hypothetical protein